MSQVPIPSARAASPVIGYALLAALIIGIGGSAVLFGTGVVNDITEGEPQSKFVVSYNNSTDYNITYEEGRTFSQSNTDEIRIRGNGSTATVAADTFPGGDLEEGDVLLDSGQTIFGYNTTLTLVWVEDSGDSRVLDTVVLDPSTSVRPASSGSSNSSGNISVVIS